MYTNNIIIPRIYIRSNPAYGIYSFPVNPCSVSKHILSDLFLRFDELNRAPKKNSPYIFPFTEYLNQQNEKEEEKNR